MVIGQSHMESGKCRSSKERMKRMRGHQRHTIKRCPLLRFEDKLEVLTPTRMNNEHTSQYSPLGWLQISAVGRTWGKFSSSARKKLILLPRNCQQIGHHEINRACLFLSSNNKIILEKNRIENMLNYVLSKSREETIPLVD